MMLILNEQDISQAVALKQVIAAVESALLLYEKGDFHMPQRMHVDYRDNTLLLMPCFAPDVFAVKLVSLFPGNPEKGLPVLMGTVILNDGETGNPLALMNGAKLTALRTGAVGGVGVRRLTPRNITGLGIVGAGVQGLHQVMFACAERDIKDIFVYDKISDNQDEFICKLANLIPDVKVHWAETVEELLSETQLIITATNSSEPVLPDDEKLLAGKYFIGIGSYKPNMREFPDALFKLVDRVVVDTDHAKAEAGDLITPLKKGLITENQIVSMGSLLAADIPTVPEEGETVLYKSVGMALFDLLVANLVYRKAQKKGLGQEINL